MSLLESIKEERNLSFNHWRYRLLHWCFSVGDVQTPEQSNLPSYLYTHYCPLFHITNLIAILLPFILVFKIAVAIVMSVFVVTQSGLESLSNYLDFVFASRKGKEKEEEQTDEQKREKDIARLVKALTDKEDGEHWRDFDFFWDYHRHHFEILTEEEAKEKHATVVKKLEKAERHAEERKKKLRARLAFWANFSRVFIKWLLNIAYIALAVFGVWAAISLIGPFFSLIGMLFTANYVPFLLFLVKGVAICFAVAGIVYGLAQIGFVEKCRRAAVAGGKTAFIPVELLWNIICVPFAWIRMGFEHFMDFVSIFYEENCPPINIVSNEDESIEEAVS